MAPWGLLHGPVLTPFVNNFLHYVGKSKGRVMIFGLVEATFLTMLVKMRGRVMCLAFVEGS